MENVSDVIGRNIRFYRKQIGLTQEKLAEKADLDRSYVGGVERGNYNVSIETLAKIAHSLQVEPFVLLVERTDTHAFVSLAEHVQIPDKE
ncbi:MAG: helix-turn-helix transcriptional regulator [Candidatus Paceibacterota bacterium]